MFNTDVVFIDTANPADLLEQGETDLVLASATAGAFETKSISPHYMYFYDIHVAAPLYGVIMSEEFFHSLSENDREALELAAKLAASATSQSVILLDGNALKELATRNIMVRPPLQGVFEKIREGISSAAASLRRAFEIVEEFSDAISIKISEWSEEAQDPGGCTVAELFYATNRYGQPQPDGQMVYLPMPSSLRVGELRLSVPKRAREAQYDAYRCNHDLRREFRCDGDLTVRLRRLENRPLSPDEFVQRWSEESPTREGLLLYVHGHAVGFDEAARQGVALRDRVGRPNLAIFSWPVIGSLGKEQYLNDRNTTHSSSSFLAEFFQQYLEKAPRMSDVSLVAHSLGNMVLFDAVRDYAGPSQAGRFARLLSVAAAVPQNDFHVLAAQISKKVEHSTVYITENDTALKLSKNYTGEDPVGLRPPTVKIDGAQLVDIDIVDASGISCKSSLDSCHSYHLDSPSMIVELRDVFKGALPTERGLIRRDFEGIHYYYIPSN